jgi:hypothetical protein
VSSLTGRSGFFSSAERQPAHSQTVIWHRAGTIVMMTAGGWFRTDPRGRGRGHVFVARKTGFRLVRGHAREQTERQGNRHDGMRECQDCRYAYREPAGHPSIVREASVAAGPIPAHPGVATIGRVNVLAQPS